MHAAGAFMEKAQQMRGSQTPVQKYWPHLLELVLAGKLDPTVVITHRPPLAEAPHAYKIFNEKLVRSPRFWRAQRLSMPDQRR